MLKIAVITANIGGFDSQKSFPKQNIECDYFAFTENNLPFPMTSLNPRMKAKYFKLQAHKLFPDHNAFIWLDSSFQIKSNHFAAYMIEQLNNYGIAVTKHPERHCIYQEAAFVDQGLKRGATYFTNRYLSSKINEEAKRYGVEEYPKNNGLYACGLFSRRNNPSTNKFFDAWWDRCLQYSVFDQLSFPVLAKKHGISINPLVFDNYLDNQYYKIVNHSK